jgi:hypothetical protein
MRIGVHPRLPPPDEELAGRRGVLMSAPQQVSYGGTDAVCDDGRGNLLNLHQD